METRARKRARLATSLDYQYRWFPMSLAFCHWRLRHLAMDVDQYDFRVFPGWETVWSCMCDPEQATDEAYIQIALLSLPASLRLPQ